MAQLTPNQITAACFAAWKEPDAPSAARKIGQRLLEEVLSQESNFSAAAERRATEAEEAMHELDDYRPPVEDVEDDANIFTGDAA